MSLRIYSSAFMLRQMPLKQTTTKGFNIFFGTSNMGEKVRQNPELVSCPFQKRFVHRWFV
jgi:hypothetical protein